MSSCGDKPTPVKSSRKTVSPPPPHRSQRKANSGQRLQPMSPLKSGRSCSDDIGALIPIDVDGSARTHDRGYMSMAVMPTELADAGKVALWPAKHNTSAREASHQSRAPLTLQLEAFIRKEHRQYLMEHPDCSRTDTLFVFKEAFSTFVDHFPEYKSVLYLIRDAYDAAIAEMTEQVNKMRLTDMENKSDRSLHAMELMHLKENLNATISNQQAQLSAAQGLVHGLREQLAAAEHANSLLKMEMEKKFHEYEAAQERVKLFSKAIIEENARSAAMLEAARKKDREMDLQRAQIKVLSENVEELENCIKEQTLRRLEGDDDPPPPAKVGARNKPAPSPAEDPDAPVDSYSKEYVEGLHHKIDELLLRDSSAAVQQWQRLANTASSTEAPAAAATTTTADSTFTVIREWLRLEGVGERDLLPTDYLIPPGLWPGEEMAFLGLCEPVFNQHLTQNDVLSLLDQFWTSRLRELSRTPLRTFLLEWSASRCGGERAGRELAANMMAACQASIVHPECHAFLCILRGFLPEQMVVVWRSAVEQIRSFCLSNPLVLAGKMPVENLMEKVRALFPEKPLVDMQQLHFCIYKGCGSLESVDINLITEANSFFMTLLKQQFFRQTEEFTLSVVEAVRRCEDTAHGTLKLTRAMDVVQELHKDVNLKSLHTFFAEGCQRTLREIATADSTTTVRAAPLLARLRSAVLLRPSGLQV